MRFFTKARAKAQETPATPGIPYLASPPDNAHGRRTYDGGYFAIWICQNGHGTPFDCDRTPQEECSACELEAVTASIRNHTSVVEEEPTTWHLASPSEVHQFIIGLEGSLTSPGFTVLV